MPGESGVAGARIALFIPSLEVGGAERVLVTLANGLSRAGCDVDVIVFRRSGQLAGELDPQVRVIDLAARRAAFALMPLARYLRRTRPQALLSTLAEANLLSVLARAVAHVRVRVVTREASTASVYNRAATGFRLKLLDLSLTAVYRAADRVVCPSRGVADDLVAHYGIARQRISVIPNPLDFDRITTLALAGSNGGRSIAGDSPLVLGVGSLTSNKDFTTLIRAFARVRRRIAARLVILGEGQERHALERVVRSEHLEPHVSLPGLVENPFAYMRNAAVYVLSSRSEGLPNTLLQALAVGTPAVATDCQSGPREILDGGRWGRLVPIGDVDAMAAAILDGLRGAIDTVPLPVLRERYSLERITGEYLDVLCAWQGVITSTVK